MATPPDPAEAHRLALSTALARCNALTDALRAVPSLPGADARMGAIRASVGAAGVGLSAMLDEARAADDGRGPKGRAVRV